MIPEVRRALDEATALARELGVDVENVDRRLEYKRRALAATRERESTEGRRALHLIILTEIAGLEALRAALAPPEPPAPRSGGAVTVAELRGLLDRVVAADPSAATLPVLLEGDLDDDETDGEARGVSVRPSRRRHATGYSEPNLLIRRTVTREGEPWE